MDIVASPQGRAALIVGVMFCVTGLPLALAKVPPNRWYGVRMRKTLADSGVWYNANARVGKIMIFLGAGALCYIGAVIGMLHFNMIEEKRALSSLSSFLGSAVIVACVYIVDILRKL